MRLMPKVLKTSATEFVTALVKSFGGRAFHIDLRTTYECACSVSRSFITFIAAARQHKFFCLRLDCTTPIQARTELDA